MTTTGTNYIISQSIQYVQLPSMGIIVDSDEDSWKCTPPAVYSHRAAATNLVIVFLEYLWCHADYNNTWLSI